MIKEQVIIKRIIVSLILISVLVPYPSIAASSKKAQLETNIKKAQTIQGNLNKLAAKYQSVYRSLIQTDNALRRTDNDIAATQKRLVERQAIFGQRIKHTYKYGKVSVLDVILGSNTFSELVKNVDFLNKIASADVELLEEIQSDQQELERQKSVLAKEKENQTRLAVSLKKEKNMLASELDRQQRLMAGLKDQIRKEELAALEAAKARRVARFSSRGGSYSFVPRKGFIFPVAGPHAFTNDWGNPRSGGRRHKGTDIFAKNGTPCVAVVSGTVVFKNGGLGGLTARLHGDDGNTYYYAHLSGYGQGGRVSAGTVIGYVGSSGNASGTAPHLHFEIWPGGRGAINPYPVLKAAN